MKILLIAPPRSYWPFISEGDNFLLPQNLVCIASVLLNKGYTVKIIDCMPLKLGWQSLANKIREEKPDVVAAGENHALYSNEIIKLFKLAKDISSHIITIAGGTHFSALSDKYISHEYIDVIVKGEGEETIVELTNEIGKSHPNLHNVNGIAFSDNNSQIINTPLRPLINDLNSLPLPAYNLVPMEKYGRSKYLFSPGGTTIHHSRGCTSNCKFCAFWIQMSEKKEVNGKIVSLPKWRTKSVANTIEEVTLLYHKYRKKCLVFVDESFNISKQWNNDFAEEILRKSININYFAFMRIDCLLRDEKEGILEKLIKSGLAHLCVGVERCIDNDLNQFGKNFYSQNETINCFTILNKKYPSLFKQATFIVGTKNETKETCLNQMHFAKKINVDFPAFHPLTPVPGTELWNQENKNGKLEQIDFSEFDWTTPILPSNYLSQDEILDLIYEMNKEFISFKWLIKGILCRYTYKRRMYLWWLLVSLRIIFDSAFRFIHPLRSEKFSNLKLPVWYNN